MSEGFKIYAKSYEIEERNGIRVKGGSSSSLLTVIII
jgi:hypothetical protein